MCCICHEKLPVRRLKQLARCVKATRYVAQIVNAKSASGATANFDWESRCNKKAPPPVKAGGALALKAGFLPKWGF
jgi:hypothetical protein